VSLASRYTLKGDPYSSHAVVLDWLGDGRGRRLLDVGAADGLLSRLLTARGWKVTGLEADPVAAAAGAPHCERMIVADLDAGVPPLPGDFDAIVCAYQGVNHLLSLSAWQSFFGCAYRHLNPGGMLVFDIATVRYLMTMASIPKVVEQFGDNYLQITVSTTDGARFRWHIEVFELQRDGRYVLLTQAVEMRSFPVDQVKEALCRRFTDIEVIGGDGRSADRESEGRIWLACARPS